MTAAFFSGNFRLGGSVVVMDEARWMELAQAHLDGRLTDAEFSELEAGLRGDAAARRRYAGLARLDAELREEMSGYASGAGQGTTGVPVKERAREGAGGRLGVVQGMAMAAGFALLVVLAWTVLRSGLDGDVGGLAGGFDSPPTAGVAVVSAEAGAVWETNGGIRPAEGVALPAGVWVLQRGLAQIDFFSGASVTLSGPAEIELISGGEAVLHRGRLKADVPPAARGFEIRAAGVLVEDLGTRFGLAVGASGEADLVVFDGEVRTIGERGEALSFYDGDAASLAGGEVQRREARELGLFPGIADVLAESGDLDESRYATWKADSAERRRDPRLIAYYDFEGLAAATRRLENRAVTSGNAVAAETGELDGGIVGARVAEGRWRSKTALDFRREGDRVRFQIPGEFEALTLAAWVRIDALDRGLNSLFLTDFYDPGEIHWQLSREGALHFATSPMGVEELERYNRRFYSERFWDPALSGRWFHLATTADRGRGEVIHYINGRRVGFSGGTNMEDPLPKMRIGAADLGNWTKPIWPSSIRTLNGRIDEFAIYAAALGEEEIFTMYERGQP